MELVDRRKVMKVIVDAMATDKSEHDLYYNMGLIKAFIEIQKLPCETAQEQKDE